MISACPFKPAHKREPEAPATPAAASDAATAGSDFGFAGSFAASLDDRGGADADEAEATAARLTRDGSASLEALHKALGEIADLDRVIGDKQAYLKELVLQRRELERQNGTAIRPRDRAKGQGGASGSAVFDERPAEVRARLMQLLPADDDDADDAAFITQTQGSNILDVTLAATSPGGLAQAPGSAPAAPEDAEADAEKKKKKLESILQPQSEFDKGDFIGRNKAMGADARFYSTLTPQEQDRVEKIMVDPDEDVFHDALEEHEQEEAHETSTVATERTAFTVEADDVTRLEHIHISALSKVVPPSEWERKLAAWTAPVTGWATPATTASAAEGGSGGGGGGGPTKRAGGVRGLFRGEAAGASTSATSLDGSGLGTPAFGGAGGRSAAASSDTVAAGERDEPPTSFEDEMKKLKALEQELETLRRQERMVTKTEINGLLLNCLRDELLKKELEASVAEDNFQPSVAE